MSLPHSVVKRTLAPAQLGELWLKHVAIADDASQTAFIVGAHTQPHSTWKTRTHRVLRAWLSDYDVNGLLGMYPMFLMSNDGWRSLLQESLPQDARGSLLDVGAGDGGLTQQLAPLFSEVTTTEASWAMARRLRRRGYRCLRQDIGETPLGETFDCVTCLNVLDRTAYPLRLLRALSRLCAPDGCLVLATPLPLRAFYYEGPQTLTPPERLFAPGPTWEHAARQFTDAVNDILSEFELLRWTDMPYLSWGDSEEPLYVLHDFVGVWRRRQ